MTLTKTDYILLALALFLQPWLFYVWAGYRSLIVLNRLLDNDSANRISFGILCSLFMVIIGYLIQLG